MQREDLETGTPPRTGVTRPGDEPVSPPQLRGEPARRRYIPPTLEALGAWSALTLQQSVPIGPGGGL